MRRYLFFGVAVYLFLVIANFPAQLALHWFAPDGIKAYGVQGPVWEGSADAISVGPVVIGETDWDLSPAWLLIGTVKADVKSRLGQSRVNTAVSRSVFGSILKLKSLQGIVFLESLPKSLWSRAAAFGVTEIDGRVGLTFQRLYLDNGRPSDAAGTVDLVDLILSTQFGVAELGNFELVFGDEAANADALTGRLADTDSPVALSGTLTFNTDRSYRLSAIAKARPGAPADIQAALQILGPEAPGGGTLLEVVGMLP